MTLWELPRTPMKPSKEAESTTHITPLESVGMTGKIWHFPDNDQPIINQFEEVETTHDEVSEEKKDREEVFPQVEQKEEPIEKEPIDSEQVVVQLVEEKISESPKELLHKGVIVTKYGRRGRPHKRIVWLTDNCDEICWRNPKKEKEKRRKISLENFQIKSGCHSKVFRRYPSVCRAQIHLCITILFPNRSLDIQFDSEVERDCWLKLMLEVSCKE